MGGGGSQFDWHSLGACLVCVCVCVCGGGVSHCLIGTHWRSACDGSLIGVCVCVWGGGFTLFNWHSLEVCL